MSADSDGRHDDPFSTRKTRDRAFILLIVGLAFLVPPIADMFQLDLRVAGIPFTALYLFLVWGLLITGAAVLSKSLKEDAAAEDDAEISDGTEKTVNE